jgi:hypothetical protein
MLLLFLFILLFIHTNAHDKFFRNLPWQFSYSSNLICDIIEHDEQFYASVADAYTFQRSQAVSVSPSSSRNPVACFLFRGHSFLVFRNALNNQTEMLRNRDYRACQFPPYEKLLFDSFTSKLYFYEANQLNYIELGELESLWFPDSKISEIKPKFSTTLEGYVLDVLVQDDELFYISKDEGLALDYIQRKLLRSPNSKNIMTRQSLYNQKIISITSTNLTAFDFIFVSITDESTMEAGNVKISALPLKITIPQRPAYNTNDKWLIALYVIDIIFFFLLAYFIRQFYPMPVKEMDSYFQLKDLKSSPLIDHLSSNRVTEEIV